MQKRRIYKRYKTRKKGGQRYWVGRKPRARIKYDFNDIDIKKELREAEKKAKIMKRKDFEKDLEKMREIYRRPMKNYGMAWESKEKAKQRLVEGYEIREVSPEKFLERTMPRISGEKEGKKTYDIFGRPLTKEETEEFLSKFYDADKDEMRPIEELAEMIRLKEKIIGLPIIWEQGYHEGRHRAYAAKKAGKKKIPIIIHKESLLGKE